MGRHKQVLHNDTEKITNEAVLAGLTDEVPVPTISAVKHPPILMFFFFFLCDPMFCTTLVIRLMLWRHIWTRLNVSNPPPTWATRWLSILSHGKPSFSFNTRSNLLIHLRNLLLNLSKMRFNNVYRHLNHFSSFNLSLIHSSTHFYPPTYTHIRYTMLNFRYHTTLSHTIPYQPPLSIVHSTSIILFVNTQL